MNHTNKSGLHIPRRTARIDDSNVRPVTYAVSYSLRVCYRRFMCTIDTSWSTLTLLHHSSLPIEQFSSNERITSYFVSIHSYSLVLWNVRETRSCDHFHLSWITTMSMITPFSTRLRGAFVVHVSENELFLRQWNNDVLTKSVLRSSALMSAAVIENLNRSDQSGPDHQSE